MITVDKAVRVVLSKTKRLGAESVGIESALGRVLAEDIYCPVNIPPFERSAMDGYAVRSADTRGASPGEPVRLKVIEDLPAGKKARRRIIQGTAAAIMTGAPMPDGADSVVMVEDTKQCGNFVDVFCRAWRGENISPAGEDLKKGELVAERGIVLGAAGIGLVSSSGRAKVKVFKRPRVSVVATGSEIVPPDNPLKAGQIRDSNSYTISLQAQSCGAAVKRLGIARDEKRLIRSKIRRAAGSDMLLLSGGVSVGKYDMVKDVLIEEGVRPIFWKVAMKPGKPVFFGTLGRMLVFGLPGYPASSMIAFDLLVRPVIAKMQGMREAGRKSVAARLLEDVKGDRKRRCFVRACLSDRAGKLFVKPVGSQKSGVLKSMALANSLIVLRMGTEKVRKGQLVEVLPL